MIFIKMCLAIKFIKNLLQTRRRSDITDNKYRQMWNGKKSNTFTKLGSIVDVLIKICPAGLHPWTPLSPRP